MQVKIHANGFPLTIALAQHAEGRLVHALNQHASLIDRVIIMLKDLNGPRGGLDKEVDITVRTIRGGVVIVKETQADLYSAISHAADRVKNAVSRLASRRVSRRRQQDRALARENPLDADRD